jgi:hypothetical protein
MPCRVDSSWRTSRYYRKWQQWLFGSNRRLSCLSEKLVQVLTLSDKQWQAMSDAAYATAVQYTWDDATDRFEAALQFACEQSQRVKTANQANTGIPAS